MTDPSPDTAAPQAGDPPHTGTRPPEESLRIALAARARGDRDAAEAMCRRVLDATPGHLGALHLLGVILTEAGDTTAAVNALSAVVAGDPTSPAAHLNLGNALLAAGWVAEADAAFGRALALRPDYALAHANRGLARLRLGEPEAATDSLAEAVRLAPTSAPLHVQHGLALRAAGAKPAALAAFERALRLDVNCAEALNHAGALLIELQQPGAAVARLARLAALAPADPVVQGNLLEARLACCDWSVHADALDTARALAARGHFIRPLTYVALDGDPDAQRRFLETYATQAAGADPATLPPPPRGACARTRTRLRIAYLAGEFREHALAYLTAGLFEAHDRARVEVLAVSLGPPEESAMARRLRAGVDRFVDVHALDDAAAAARLHDLDLDIVVDLSGHTGMRRLGLLARRCAPVQVHYLGFPGTLGHPAVDYLLADAFVAPPGSERYYREHVVRLPASFQVNDDRRSIGPATPRRADCGLPQEAVVLAALHGGYKLGPEIFGVWMRLLTSVPAAVLWLNAGDGVLEENLRREAAARGVEPARLVFAPRSRDHGAHLARLALADLGLDTLPFNGGTTTSDALWAGLPVVTCAGASFASRMAGSLLRAVGLPELVTANLADYATLAHRLAEDPALRATFRARLAEHRRSAPLFDTRRSARALEAAYTEMHRRHAAGLPPATFAVDADGAIRAD